MPEAEIIPQFHQHQYDALRRLLQAVKATITESDVDSTTLKARVAEVQQFFQGHILNLNQDELSPAIAQRVQSILVEIDKQLRLLAMDAMFLGAARQSATSQQRRSQMGDRLDTLIRYCDVLLGSGE